MDFVRGNILFTSSPTLEITGILDFEKAARGHPSFDIARTLAFLYVDCKYKEVDQVRRAFLLSGYHRYGRTPYRPVTVRTTLGPYDLLETLIDIFLLYDFYKFLRHNPYESLSINEHFVRTCQLLAERQLVERCAVNC